MGRKRNELIDKKQIIRQWQFIPLSTRLLKYYHSGKSLLKLSVLIWLFKQMAEIIGPCTDSLSTLNISPCPGWLYGHAGRATKEGNTALFYLSLGLREGSAFGFLLWPWVYWLIIDSVSFHVRCSLAPLFKWGRASEKSKVHGCWHGQELFLIRREPVRTALSISPQIVPPTQTNTEGL